MEHLTDTLDLKKVIYKGLQRAGWKLANKEKLQSGFLSSPIIFFPHGVSKLAFQATNEMTFHVQMTESKPFLLNNIDFSQEIYVYEFQKNQSMFNKYKMSHFLKKLHTAKTEKEIYSACLTTLSHHAAYSDDLATALLNSIQIKLKNGHFIPVDDAVIKDAIKNKQQDNLNNKIDVAILALKEITGKHDAEDKHTLQQILYGKNKLKYAGDKKQYQFVEKSKMTTGSVLMDYYAHCGGH